MSAIVFFLLLTVTSTLVNSYQPDENRWKILNILNNKGTRLYSQDISQEMPKFSNYQNPFKLNATNYSTEYREVFPGNEKILFRPLHFDDTDRLEDEDGMTNEVDNFKVKKRGRKGSFNPSGGVIPYNERRYETCQRTGKLVDIVLNTGYSEVVIAVLAEKCHEGIIETETEIWECEQHFTEISINGRLHNITTGCDIKRRIDK